MIYVDAIYYSSAPSRVQRKNRQRYLQYYRDLHARYGVPLDENSFLEGSQYRFSELGHDVFKPCAEDGYLDRIDLMVASYWAHEYDPEYASCGPYFSHYYKFNADMFDVLDQGSICAYTALEIITAYMNNKSCEMAWSFSLEQDTNPRQNVRSINAPDQNIAAGLILNYQQSDKTLLSIIDCGTVNEKEILEGKACLHKIIKKIVEKNDIDLNECQIVMKHNSIIDKSLRYYRASHDMQLKEIYYLPLQKTCTLMYWALFNYQEINQKQKPYTLIVEEDEESFTVGYMLVN